MYKCSRIATVQLLLPIQLFICFYINGVCPVLLFIYQWIQDVRNNLTVSVCIHSSNTSKLIGQQQFQLSMPGSFQSFCCSFPIEIPLQHTDIIPARVICSLLQRVLVKCWNPGLHAQVYEHVLSVVGSSVLSWNNIDKKWQYPEAFVNYPVATIKVSSISCFATRSIL